MTTPQPQGRLDRIAGSRLLRGVVGVLVLAHDAIVWAGGPLWRFIARLRLLTLLAQWVSTLPRWAVLIVLLVPFAIAEPLKLGGLYVMATGQVTTGVALQLVGHALSILLVERILHAGLPQLLTWRWFASGWAWLMAIRDAVLAWPGVVATRRIAREFGVRARAALADVRAAARRIAAPFAAWFRALRSG